MNDDLAFLALKIIALKMYKLLSNQVEHYWNL